MKMSVRALTGAVAASVALTGAPTASAEPTVGSPLVGDFCSAGAPIVGEGASFAKNAHELVFKPAYAAECGAGSITYLPNGSGAGKSAALNRTAGFAGSDEPLSLDELMIDTADQGESGSGRVSPLHHIPIATGAVTVAVNLGQCGVGQEQLNLRGPVIGAMYTGLIRNWNDPLVVADNPTMAACNLPVQLAARSDGSGTTYAFKDFLSKRFPVFQVYKQNDQNTVWPAEELGLATVARGNKNSGVAAVVAATPGAIGYVDLSTALQAGLTMAKVDGPHGQFVSARTNAAPTPNAANCEFAALGATHPVSTLSPGWDAVSITDSPNPLAYPVCTFTYALLYNNLKSAGVAANQAQAQTIVDYLGVAVSAQGQQLLPNYGYARLPANLQLLAQVGLATVTNN